MSKRSGKSPKAKAPAKGTVYNAAEVDQARAGHYYMRLGGKGGKLYLTGARQMWAKNPGFAYLQAFRAAGTPEDLLAVLVTQGYPEADVRAHLAAAYTKATAGTAGTNPAFDAELDAAKNRPKESKGKEAAYASLRSISYYVDRLDEAKETSPKKRTASPKKGKAGKKGKKGGKAKSPKKGTKGGKRAKAALADRYNKLAEGKVLDVSKYTKKDKEASVIKAPTVGGRSKKIQVPGLQVVSDKRSNLKSALQDMGYDEDTVKQWLEAWDGAHSGKAAAASPVRAPPAAPAVATLMPPAPAVAAPAVPRVASPRGPAVPAVPGAPRMPTATVGSPRGSPRL